jgi:hypothetical protein
VRDGWPSRHRPCRTARAQTTAPTVPRLVGPAYMGAMGGRHRHLQQSNTDLLISMPTIPAVRKLWPRLYRSRPPFDRFTNHINNWPSGAVLRRSRGCGVHHIRRARRRSRDRADPGEAPRRLGNGAAVESTTRAFCVMASRSRREHRQTLDTYFRSVDGDTRIDLAHDGRERLGDVGVERRDGYHKIARYAETLAPMYCTRRVEPHLSSTQSRVPREVL